MSLSKPRKKSPVDYYFEWSGSKGVFQYWDKSEERNIEIENDMYIIPLDELATVKGFNEKSKSGIYSNEVRNIGSDILNVKSFKGEDIASGKWSEIKDKVGNAGGKFSKSVYAVLLSENEEDYKLINIQFYGSSLGGFIDANIDVDSGIPVKLSPSTTELVKGNTHYFSPEIVKLKKRPDVIEKCIEYDILIQNYLDEYFSKAEAVSVNKSVNKENFSEEHEKVERVEEKRKLDPREVQFMNEREEHDEFNDIDDLPF